MPIPLLFFNLGSGSMRRRELVRTLYKDFIATARLLEPEAKSADALTQIRQNFRANLGETNS